MTETRRNSKGQVLGPAVYDPRSYDERQLDQKTRGEDTQYGAPLATAMEKRSEPRIYYQDSAVTLWLGDCRDVLPTLEAVDHVITDPPYSRDVYLRASAVYTKTGSGTPKRMGLSEGKRRGGALQKMANGDIGAMDAQFMDVLTRLIAPRLRRWLVVFSDAESTHLWKNAAESSGLRFVRTGAWVKPNTMPQMSGDRPAVGYEPCTIAHAKGPMRWNGGGKAAVWTYDTARGADRPDGHPCPKPEALMREMVLDFTDEGEVIVDLFSGSGTTGVAAKRLGRKAVLIDCEEAYCELAAKRLAATTCEPRLIPSKNMRGPQGNLLKGTVLDVEVSSEPDAVA